MTDHKAVLKINMEIKTMRST